MRSSDAPTGRLRTSAVSGAVVALCGVVLAAFAAQAGRTLSLVVACVQVAAGVWILVDNGRELRRRAARDR
ncbi:hypothetical protein [Cellulomonas sp.]|uniref:hypothetical protein n=1 Tax=Cellulomonas sp. TaxID=40001 RepID=UPI002D2DD8A3|nr:hypothetical protein [Cellulomonas sp.]HYQ77290.1 hypothetical protein [Cellulomonas sp.]